MVFAASTAPEGYNMKNARQIAVVLGVIVGIILLLALQISAFAGPLPAPAPDNNLCAL